MKTDILKTLDSKERMKIEREWKKEAFKEIRSFAKKVSKSSNYKRAVTNKNFLSYKLKDDSICLFGLHPNAGLLFGVKAQTKWKKSKKAIVFKDKESNLFRTTHKYQVRSSEISGLERRFLWEEHHGRMLYGYTKNYGYFENKKAGKKSIFQLTSNGALPVYAEAIPDFLHDEHEKDIERILDETFAFVMAKHGFY